MPERNEPVLTVCIVSYNAADDVRCALASIRRFVDVEAEAIVVDNNSTDGTREMVATEFPEVQLVHNPDNEGYAPAMNIAFERARGRYVLALSQDAELQPGTARALVDFMDAHEDVGICGPRTIDGEGQIVTTLHHPSLMLSIWTQLIPVKSWLRRRASLRRWLTRLFPNSSGMTSDYGTSHEVAVLDGGCLLFRRAALNVTGFLDPRLMQGPDDYDSCFRMHRAGYRTWYVAEAEIVHRTYAKDDLHQLSPAYLRTQLPQLSYLYSKYHGRFWWRVFSMSAWLLNTKWRLEAAFRYGRNSRHVAALREASIFCLDPERYAREYRALWAKN
jgi:GT2 family glycosyltransferase